MDSIVFLYHQRLWTYGKILDKIVRQGGVHSTTHIDNNHPVYLFYDYYQVIFHFSFSKLHIKDGM